MCLIIQRLFDKLNVYSCQLNAQIQLQRIIEKVSLQKVMAKWP